MYVSVTVMILPDKLKKISPTAYRELSSDFQEAGGFSLMILRPDDDCFVK